jgi:hypothetical protein
MRSFLWINKMATDVEVQFFSHLNGLTLGNNQGDLIRLLDKALVTGINFTEITSASINEQGDVTINLYAAHNAMLFQIVELSGFSPASLNQKYRIKGVPSATQLILKPQNEIGTTVISTVGAGKLASLGYEIIFRDANDVKRVYRAKNPTAQHPFIRVDESLASATGSYTSTYAKFAMVGLLEHMDHIDDFENMEGLQLPFDPTDPTKNWKITGTGTGVIRGWARWKWAKNYPASTDSSQQTSDSAAPDSYSRAFTIVGDKDAFYFLTSMLASFASHWKVLYGCGLYQNNQSLVTPPWFLAARLVADAASVSESFFDTKNGLTPLMNNDIAARFAVNNPMVNSEHLLANGVLPDLNSGLSGVYANTPPGALQIPIATLNKQLVGNLKHINYVGSIMITLSVSNTTPKIYEASMYVLDRAFTGNTSANQAGGFAFYLGELE